MKNPTSTTKTMARFYSMPLLLSSSAFHLRHYSSVESAERLRNIWISGLTNPAKVTWEERFMLYTGKIEELNEARRVFERKQKEHRDFICRERRKCSELIKCTFCLRRKLSRLFLQKKVRQIISETTFKFYGGRYHFLQLETLQGNNIIPFLLALFMEW